jgi:hypothetical protein
LLAAHGHAGRGDTLDQGDHVDASVTAAVVIPSAKP